MKTKTILSVLALSIAISAFSQKPTLVLTFTAENNVQYVPLDSILIENITQGCDTMLYSPDTILVLDYVSGIDKIEPAKENTFSLSQNYPNPFNEKTEFCLDLHEKENITIIVRDITGKEVAAFNKTLNPNNHTFAFYSGNENYYLLTVIGGQTSQSIKMAAAGNNSVTTEKCKLCYTGSSLKPTWFKHKNALNNFYFYLGDEMRFTGYANTLDGTPGSAVISDLPQTNSSYTFAIKKGLRCPESSTVTDVDGNIYNTVLIGAQCWMQENLKTTTYNSGILIPNITDNSTWQNSATGVYAWYGNHNSWKELYGALYNWHAVEDSNGLCPVGWHVPANEEWTTLTNYIGGTSTPFGNMLKSCRQEESPMGGQCNTMIQPRWDLDLDHYGTDDFGFSALPAGTRYIDGTFMGMNQHAVWWTGTTYYTGKAWNRHLTSFYGRIDIYTIGKRNGFSIRCIRD